MSLPIPNAPYMYAARFRVKFRGIFDAKGLYTTMYEWLKDDGWVDVVENTGNRFETLYLDRTDADGSKEIYSWLRLKKTGSSSTGTNYIIYKLNIEYHFVSLTSAEVMYEGKKVKCNKGELEMKIISFVEINYAAWRKSSIFKPFIEMFYKRIISTEMEDHRKRLYREIYTLQGAIKKYLKLKGFLPQHDLQQFHPSRAFG